MNAGFSGDDDKRRMKLFHQVDWPGRAAIVETFDDRRLVRLGRRLLMQHVPSLIDSDTLGRMSVELARRMLSDPADVCRWTTLDAAELAAASLLHGCVDSTRALVEPVRSYLADVTARCRRTAA